jgi:S1-C subfamily serine protease
VTLRFTYDPRGYRTETAYFDEDNRPTLHTYGYTKVLVQYNDKGQPIERAYVGLDGALVPHTDGNAKVRLTYNERGKIAQRAFFDAQDRPVQLIYGYTMRRLTYDDLGRETTPVFFDVHGVPVHTRVVVKKVEPDRAGAQWGLHVGDILVSYDGQEIRDTRTFREWELEKGECSRELRLQRQGQEVSLTVLPGRLTGLELEDSTESSS